MGGNPLTDFAIRQSLEQFVETVWENGLFLQEFLNNKINERQIIIGDWANITPADTDSVKYERAISAMHPLPISLPWLPMAVHSSNIQTIEYNRSLSRLLIVEISTIKGIPFVDPCLVTEWNVVETSASTCHAYITLRFQYETSSSWLKSMVESNSTAELIKFFENWEIYYAEKLQKIKENDEIEMSPGLHQLAHLLPVMSTQSVSHGDDAKLESESLEKLPAISSEVNLGLSPSTVYSDSLVMTRESVLSNSTQDLAQNGSSTYRAESVDKLASLVRPDLAVEHLTVNVNIARNTNENEKEVSSSASPINDINILKVCLSGLQSNCRIKFAATIVINLYAKIDVAALHGIKVTDAFRTILDQTASLSIIFCFIVIAEMIVALSAVTIAALSTTEFIEYVDDSDRKIGRKFQVFGRRLRETASALLLNSSVTFFKVKVPAICVSIGTQTDFPEAVSFTSRAFDDRFRNNAPILVETYDGHLGRHVGDSQRSRKNSDDNTWRDCQSPHFHPIVQHTLPS